MESAWSSVGQSFARSFMFRLWPCTISIYSRLEGLGV